MILFKYIRTARSAMVLIACSGLLASPTLGQDAELSVGSRLRVATPCDSGQGPSAEVGSVCLSTGNLVSLERDSVTVEAPDATHTYAISDLVRAEIGDGVRSYKWVGAGIGGAVGAVVTHLVLNTGGSTSRCDSSANQDAMSTGLCLGLTALGGIAGAGLGSFIGGSITVQQWREVSLDTYRVGIRLPLSR